MAYASTPRMLRPARFADIHTALCRRAAERKRRRPAVARGGLDSLAGVVCGGVSSRAAVFNLERQEATESSGGLRWPHPRRADGPLVDDACAVQDDRPIAAILIALPAKHSLEDAVGLPQLTWIFVAPFHTRRGIGTALLDNAVQVLRRLGYSRLSAVPW